MAYQVNRGYNGEIYKSIFFNMLLSGILYGWILCIGNVVDSIFAGNFIGAEGIAAVGFFSPVQVFIWLLINIISNGTNVVIGRIIGSGKFSEANKIFSLFGIISLLVGLLLTGLALVFTMPLCSFLGARENALVLTSSYVKGFVCGLPAMMLSRYLISLMAYSNNQKKMSLVTSLLHVSSNTILNFLLVKFLKLGMFGLGLATALGNWILVFFLLIQYLLHKSVLSFDFKKLPFAYIKKIFANGISSASIEIFILIRMFAFNKFLFHTGGVVAVSAYAVACVIEGFMNAISNGIADSVFSVGGVILGEKDLPSLKSFSGVLYKYGLLIMTLTSLVVFFIAPYVCIPFVPSDKEALGLSVEAVRYLAISFVFVIIFKINMRFYQIQELNLFVGIIYFFSNLVIPVGGAFLLTHHFSVKGVWYALVVKEFLSLVLIWLCAAIKLKKPFFSVLEFITLSKEMPLDSDKQISLSVTSQEDVLKLVGYILDFGQQHGMTKKNAMYTAMAIEETAGNIVRHGFSADNKKHSIDIKITRHEDSIVASVKDNCKPFDPTMFYKFYDNSDPAKNIGIRVIYSICKDIQYKSMFGLNVLMFKMK